MSLKENPLPVGYVEAPVESFLGVNAEGLVQLPELLRQQIAAASLPSHARVNQMGARLFVPSHQGLQDLNAMQAEAEVEDLDSNNQVTASPIRVRTVGELGQVAGLGNISLENSLKYATGCMMTNCVESDMGWKVHFVWFKPTRQASGAITAELTETPPVQSLLGYKGRLIFSRCPGPCPADACAENKLPLGFNERFNLAHAYIASKLEKAHPMDEDDPIQD